MACCPWETWGGACRVIPAALGGIPYPFPSEQGLPALPSYEATACPWEGLGESIPRCTVIKPQQETEFNGTADNALDV